jgi:dCMP deaminase
MRISKEQYQLAIACTAALRSEDPHLQVGAAVFDQYGRVLSTGYNGLVRSFGAPPEFWQDREAKSKFMIHAEVNALSLVSVHDLPSSIAITHSPCIACARMIAASGILRVYYKTLYDREPEALKVLEFYGITHEKL